VAKGVTGIVEDVGEEKYEASWGIGSFLTVGPDATRDIGAKVEDVGAMAAVESVNWKF
jgi:hypothetical protein